MSPWQQKKWIRRMSYGLVCGGTLAYLYLVHGNRIDVSVGEIFLWRDGAVASARDFSWVP